MHAREPALLRRWTLPTTLFANPLSRRALVNAVLPAPSGPVVRVKVWRNHAFEPLLPLIQPYTAWGGWQPRFELGPYDDGLAFAQDVEADLQLVWLDRARIALEGRPFVHWLASRLAALRQRTTAPIVLATWARDAAESAALASAAADVPAVHWADLEAACSDTGATLLDTRTAALAGTPLSATAQMLAARRLACHWLPGAALPPVKAVALDLDHTLHRGVLGEDGADGVTLTPAHAALQAEARALRGRGVFLALVSRNQADDVQALFEKRNDYPLRWSDFSAAEVSWDDKGESLARIAARLRISTDAVLMVDDNPGELLAAAARAPGAKLLLAQADAELTRASIAHWPGLWRWVTGADDTRRIADLQANAQRERFAATLDPDAVRRELQIVLRLHADDRSLLPRLAELSKKTNQFNLAVARLPEAELAARMAASDAGVCAVALRDRLADSGTVAMVAARREGARLIVDDLCISCRAMGRGLEDSLIASALTALPCFAGCDEVAFVWQHAPRNDPAREWLAAFCGSSVRLLAPGMQTVPAARITGHAAHHTLSVERAPDVSA